jgi:carbonic anhydrase
VQHALQNLVKFSDIIQSAVQEGQVKLVGSEYDMRTGIVHWMGGGSNAADRDSHSRS